MPRNLDMTALRSFVTVAEKGGVTRASGFLNLTQSAVSMQLKRLEEALDLPLLDRTARTVSLTATGEQLLSYARRMLDLNDEVMSRMTDNAYEGEVTLGAPHDVLYPAIPQVLKSFSSEFPRVKVHLISSNTNNLKSMFDRGEVNFILTTEDGVPQGAQSLTSLPLVWIGADGGTAYRERPIRLAFASNCIFRGGAQAALDEAGVAWEMGVDTTNNSAVNAIVAADLAVHAALAGTEPPYTKQLPTNCGLPDLTTQHINLYRSDAAKGAVADAMEALLAQYYAAM